MKNRNVHYKAFNRYIWDVDAIKGVKANKKYVLSKYRGKIHRQERRQAKYKLRKGRYM